MTDNTFKRVMNYVNWLLLIVFVSGAIFMAYRVLQSFFTGWLNYHRSVYFSSQPAWFLFVLIVHAFGIYAFVFQAKRIWQEIKVYKYLESKNN